MANGFVTRLNEACREAGMEGHGFQADLRRRLKEERGREMTPQGISNWFQGKTTPRVDALRDLAIIVNKSPSWLEYGDEAVPEPQLLAQADHLVREIQLTPALWKFVDDLVANGGYADEADVIRSALRELQKYTN